MAQCAVVEDFVMYDGENVTRGIEYTPPRTGPFQLSNLSGGNQDSNQQLANPDGSHFCPNAPTATLIASGDTVHQQPQQLPFNAGGDICAATASKCASKVENARG